MPAFAPTPADTTLLRRRVVQTPVAPASPLGRRVLHYLLVFAIVVLAVDGLAGDNGLLDRIRATRDYDAQLQALEAQRLENERLRYQIRRLRDDPAEMEALARRELGLIRPGERLFIIRDARPVRR